MTPHEFGVLLEAIDLLSEFYDFDDYKVCLWITRENENFECKSPIKMFYEGNGQEVLDFIKYQLSIN